MDKSELRIVKKFLDPYYEIETDEEFSEYLKKINSSECLHILASEINWDGDLEAIYYVINHPNCDRGTALLVYWYNQPGYWGVKSESDIYDYEIDSFNLHNELQKRLLGDYYNKSNICFDPFNERGTDWVSALNKRELESIPKSLVLPNAGNVVADIEWTKI